ncbi:MBL fold metallo-hydrolase [Deinococcus radiotolerans]|uniref:MBL fold metallo-hydrolase n=1 Tax=Deinococcus radiotolerans TaxID=1309407 RepID=A0ABQ2FD38_9DEIO|nr:MBL fold metallo-hydrolase [Deinococcus radiotolerans]GGK86687.1 MBL fold metallo-hydrolase [Deinococcus radiotolerans]
MTPPVPHASITFLGTGDSKGVPRFWCACPVCQEARTGGQNRRGRTATLLRVPLKDGAEGTALLDARPDTHAALARLPGPLVPDVVLITHAHNDHILGLGDLLDYVRYARGKLQVYAPAEVIPALAQRFPYAFSGEGPVQPLPEAGVTLGDVTLRLFRVPHGANGHSHAVRLDAPHWRAAVFTDAIDVPPDVAQAWLSGLDLLALGTSFEDESGVPHRSRSVYDVREALDLPWARGARQVVLTHLSHGVDVRRGAVLPPGWSFAHDQLSVALTPGTRV